MKDIILISKDILRPDYLSCYSGKTWKTPNIDELGAKGTIFRRHYASAPSTAMSLTSMFTGLPPHLLNRKIYTEVEPFEESETLFGVLNKKGYKTYVISPKNYAELAWRYSKVFSEKTIFHGMDNIHYSITNHKFNQGKKSLDDEETAENVLRKVSDIIDGCLKDGEDTFIWIHLPHCLLGRTSYGADIDLFDKLVGAARERFDDDGIYITSDHGHMNGQKGICVYGFHVYEGAIRIPLITPRIGDKKEILFPTSNIQLADCILSGFIEKKTYVHSDSQYYCQWNRKLAVIKGDYKYIYNKWTKSEELYDLEYDPNEDVNLLIDNWYDRNRRGYYFLDNMYYYPRWDQAKEVYAELKKEKERLWRDGSWFDDLGEALRFVKHRKFLPSKSMTIGNKKVKGRWGSKVLMPCYQV